MKHFFPIKKISALAFVLFLTPAAFAFGGFAFSFGSGYVFYNDGATKTINKSLTDPAQIILNTGFAYRIPLAPPVNLAVGAETVADFRWNGDTYAHNLDYAGLVGVEIYPGVAGLFFTVDYALGRRTTFYKVTDDDSKHRNTHWGNGFRLGIVYDFGYKSDTFLSPQVGASWRRMPRGGGADNILSVFFKLTLT